MRRALITNEFAPQHGGVERLLHERARGFEPENLTVFAAHTGDCDAFDLVQPFISHRSGRWIAKIPYLRNLARSITPMVRCYREHRREPFELIECGQVFPACLFAWLVHKRYSTRYLVWVHGNDLLGPSRFRFLRAGIRKSLQQAEAVIANSSYTARMVSEFGMAPERIRLIPPLVDREKFRPGPPSQELLVRYGFENKKVLLTVCRLVERKGVDLTLRALSQLVTEWPDIRFLIVGDGPRRKELESLSVKLGLQGYVVFTGAVPEHELVAHYNLASVFVMPSRFLPNEASVEGLGLVYLEAMACSLPIIAGRSGGVPDIVKDGENGLLVDPGSVSELARSIDTLLRDSAYSEQLGCNGLAFVRQTRDWTVLDI